MPYELWDGDQLSLFTDRADAIMIGYGHASMVRMLHPSDRTRPSKEVINAITRQRCTCPDDHVEIWAVPL